MCVCVCVGGRYMSVSVVVGECVSVCCPFSASFIA